MLAHGSGVDDILTVVITLVVIVAVWVAAGRGGRTRTGSRAPQRGVPSGVVDVFEAARRQVIARVAARLADAVRRGDADEIDLCEQLLPKRPATHA